MATAMSEDALNDGIRMMLGEFGHHSTSLVRGVARGNSDRDVCRLLPETLIDEDTSLRCCDKPHYELALDFATRFAGMSVKQVADYPIPCAIQDMNHFRLRLSQDEPVGVARACLGIAGEAGFSRNSLAEDQGFRLQRSAIRHDSGTLLAS